MTYKDYSWLKDHCYEVLKRPCSPDTTSEYLAILDLIKEHEERSWIPVDERSPEVSGKYLVTFGGTYRIGEDFYNTEEDARRDFEEYYEEYTGWCSHNVIAWMPLPKPYKAESVE